MIVAPDAHHFKCYHLGLGKNVSKSSLARANGDKDYHIFAAICTYSLVAIVQKEMQLERSTYEVLQILSISLTDKTYLRDLFDKTKFQNDKERFGSNEPSLFNL